MILVRAISEFRYRACARSSPNSEVFRAIQICFRTFFQRIRYDLNVKCRSQPRLEETGMTATATVPTRNVSALRAIGAGGLIAGTLDLTQASILFGIRVPLVIAAGLLGRGALHGGAGTYALGVLLHFFIATSAAAIYYTASRRLPFLVDYWIICGLFFGAAVEEVMSLIVLPLSALHEVGPYELRDLIQGLGVHMVVVGLPIAYCVRRFGR
jgi:uncharacterized membrane protein